MGTLCHENDADGAGGDRARLVANFPFPRVFFHLFFARFFAGLFVSFAMLENLCWEREIGVEGGKKGSMVNLGVFGASPGVDWEGVNKKGGREQVGE